MNLIWWFHMNTANTSTLSRLTLCRYSEQNLSARRYIHSESKCINNVSMSRCKCGLIHLEIFDVSLHWQIRCKRPVMTTISNLNVTKRQTTVKDVSAFFFFPNLYSNFYRRSCNQKSVKRKNAAYFGLCAPCDA